MTIPSTAILRAAAALTLALATVACSAEVTPSASPSVAAVSPDTSATPRPVAPPSVVASAPSDAAVPGSLAGTSWTVASVDQTVMAPDRPPTMTFEATQVRGSSGCNGYSAAYRFDPDTATLEIHDFITTLRRLHRPGRGR